MSRYDVVHEIFTGLQKKMDSDQEVRLAIREKCKAIDQIAREITSVLQIIHHSEEEISEACQKTRGLLDKAREGFKALREVVPPNKYYKYRDHWRNVNQKLSFGIALMIWLEIGVLADYDVAAEILELETEATKDGFYLELEDYLSGILKLCTEMTRLILNAASRGEDARVWQIYTFVQRIYTGFVSLSDIESDGLLKRVDALKYDVLRVEEIFYSTRIRGKMLEGQNAGDIEERVTTLSIS